MHFQDIPAEYTNFQAILLKEYVFLNHFFAFQAGFQLLNNNINIIIIMNILILMVHGHIITAGSIMSVLVLLVFQLIFCFCLKTLNPVPIGVILHHVFQN